MKKRILVVEDEDMNMDYIQSVLAPISNLTLRYNGQEALDIFNSEPFDIVITDLQMPVMSGYEMVKRIREVDKDIPIIVTTAYAMAGDKEKALEIGATDYISKPIQSYLLLRSVLRILNNSEDLDTTKDELMSFLRLARSNHIMQRKVNLLHRSFLENELHMSNELKSEISWHISRYQNNKAQLLQMKSNIPKSLETIYKELYFEFLETENIIDKLKLIHDKI